MCVEGCTNEAIAHRLGLSVGTVNTYWLRIKLKVGGGGRTATVARVIKDRAERALREADSDRRILADMVAEKERGVLEVRAAIALFRFAMAQIKSTVWATDRELAIHILANGEFPSTHCGVTWDVGKTIYDIFKTDDPSDPAIAAHLKALEGVDSEVQLQGEFSNMMMRVMSLRDEADEVMG
ncbi:MAG TPA: hypothetical protein VKT78_11180, partial [Fimbriimonadaceae bacterium]|nr:hypothetical protein [Fimbriimonadaceae bacterium]